MGLEAVKAARDAGAQALVSACPFCETNLSAASQIANSPVPVYDIIDLVSDALGIESK
jgi:heterodisulfide reductase subunit B